MIEQTIRTGTNTDADREASAVSVSAEKRDNAIGLANQRRSAAGWAKRPEHLHIFKARGAQLPTRFADRACGDSAGASTVRPPSKSAFPKFVVIE
jgi:hypothetical protein